MTSSEIKILVREFRNMAALCIPDGEGQQAYNYCAERLELAIPKHKWQWYLNGTFCSQCGAQLGDGREDCRGND